MTRKFLTFTTLCILSAGGLFSQSPLDETGFVFSGPADTVKRDTVMFNIDVDISLQLLPLDTILEIAYENSPSIKFEEAMVQSKVWDYRYTRLLFFQGFSGFYNYAVGNQALVVTGSTPVDNSQLSNGYRAGVNIQIPISTLFGQSKKNKMMRSLIEASRQRKEEVRRDLKREILRVYVNMVEGQRKLNIRTEDAQASFTSTQVAEEELAQGKIHPSEYSRIRNIYAIAQSNVELERANFLRAFYDFEALVGVDMRYLKRTEQPQTLPPNPNK